jgi:CheY-like chemotaxis protein
MIVPDGEARPTVVVIDDDPDIREVLRGFLRSVGLRAELFASVQECLNSAHPGLPGRLVLDCETARAKRARFSGGAGQGKFARADYLYQWPRRCPMSIRAMKAGRVRVPDQTRSRSRFAGRDPARHRRIAPAATTNELLPSVRIRLGTQTPRERSAQRSRQTKPSVEKLG